MNDAEPVADPGTPRPQRWLRLPGRTPRGRIGFGVVLAVVGFAALLVAIVALNFLHRLSDRVDVSGTVKQGYDITSASSADPPIPLSDGEFGYWKVDYEIDGTPHTGLMRGAYDAGETITVSVPGDGSVYRLITEADPIGIKIASWPVALAGAIALVAGLIGVIGGSVQLARATRRDANSRMSAMTGIPVDVLEARQRRRPRAQLGGAPPPTTEPQWQKVQPTTRPDPDSPFYRPYDLDAD